MGRRSLSVVYLGFFGLPVSSITKNAFTLPIPHCWREETSGRWDELNAPMPRLMTALSVADDVLDHFCLPASRILALCSLALTTSAFCCSAESTIPDALLAEADEPGLLTEEPEILSEGFAGVAASLLADFLPLNPAALSCLRTSRSTLADSRRLPVREYAPYPMFLSKVTPVVHGIHACLPDGVVYLLIPVQPTCLARILAASGEVYTSGSPTSGVKGANALPSAVSVMTPDGPEA